MDYSRYLPYCKTERQTQVIEALIKFKTKTAAAEVLGINARSVYRTIDRIKNEMDLDAVEFESDENEILSDYHRKLDDLSSNYHEFVKQREFSMLITSAQNGTPVHKNFWRNLENLSKKELAKRLVIPFRYKNPTSVFTDLNHDFWDESLKDHLCESDFHLCDNLSILGDLKIQPTATRPLSGLEQVSGDKSAIVAHSKLELKAVATPSNRFPKLLMSTGCCTIENYTNSKAGYKGKKRHSLSAILVKVKGKKFFTRQIVADNDGNFIDMKTQYHNGKVSKAPRAHVLSTGDLHAANADKKALDATFFADDSMVNYFRPKYITLDDSLDFESGSHHNKKDPVVQHHLLMSGRSCVEGELKNTFKLMGKISNVCPTSKIVVKRSNHDEHLERWVKETDPRKDPLNCRIWCEAFTTLLDGKDLYKEVARTRLPHFDRFYFLERDEQFVVDDVTHDGHGDLGANGSRGGLLGFTKLGCPGQWGHSHTPGIMDDQYQNGTLCRLRVGYNRGPSSWMHCNTIQYANGKRSLLFIIEGEWHF